MGNKMNLMGNNVTLKHPVLFREKNAARRYATLCFEFYAIG